MMALRRALVGMADPPSEEGWCTMRSRFSPFAILLPGLMLVLSACGSDNPVALPDPTFIGIWKFAVPADEDGIRVYERLQERTVEAEFDMQESGLLWIRRSAYVGGDWPTTFHCEGTWYEEQSGVVVFSYLFRDVLTSDRLTVLSVDEFEMRCRLSRLE